MDPDAALADALDFARDILNDEAPTYPDNLGQDATGLAEKFMALHEWLINGGYLPEQWRGQ